MREPFILDSIILDARAYLLSGDDYLRAHRSTWFSNSIVAGIRSGYDGVSLTREILAPLEDFKSSIGQIQGLMVGLMLRLLGTLVLIFIARFFLITKISDFEWNSWLMADRISGLFVVFFGVFFGFLIFKFMEPLRWSKTKDQRLGQLFSEYCSLGSRGVHDKSLREDLRTIARAELQYGVDGFHQRIELFKRDLMKDHRTMKSWLPKLGYLFILAELLTFVMGTCGFLLIPLMAWLETASGS